MDRVPDWNTYFMNIANAVSLRSKDPATKVGSILVNDFNHIIGTGYNGMPVGIEETDILWQRPTKYQYVIHAESNCLYHADKERLAKDTHLKLYCTMFPCVDCSKKIILHKNIKEILYRDDKYKSDEALYLFTVNNIGVIRV